MLAAIEHLRASGVEVASLIHDGVLVKSSDENNVDLEELGGHGSRTTGLKCIFAVKTLDLCEDDTMWIQHVEDGYTDSQR
jgi:hypothetical protein